MRNAHALDTVRFVQPIWCAGRGHSFAGGALDFPCERFARREKEFLPSPKRDFSREERIVSLEYKVDFLVEEDHLLENNIVNLETKLASRFWKVSFRKSLITALEAQPYVPPEEHLSITPNRDRFRRLLRSLSHHFESSEVSVVHWR